MFHDEFQFDPLVGSVGAAVLPPLQNGDFWSKDLSFVFVGCDSVGRDIMFDVTKLELSTPLLYCTALPLSNYRVAPRNQNNVPHPLLEGTAAGFGGVFEGCR